MPGMAIALCNGEIAVSASRIRMIGLSLALLSVPGASPAPGHMSAGPSDFAFLDPWFTVGPQDRDTLAQRAVLVRALPASDRQVSILAACAVDRAAGEPEVDAGIIGASAIGTGKHGELMTGRFSEPARLDDLSRLTLDQGDIDRLRSCRRGECALNLSDREMADLQLALAQPPVAPSAVQDAFRRMLLGRVAGYRSGGVAALPEYHDRRDPVQPAAVLSAIRRQIPYMNAHLPAVAEYLDRYPFAGTAGASTSLHWSRLMVNSKPVVAINHLTTFRPEPSAHVPAVLTVSQTVYASRYLNGELTLWMLFAPGAAVSYVVYVTRLELDTLGDTFGGLKRSVIESRMKDAAARLLNCQSSGRN